MIHKSQKLNREERIRKLDSAINSISNLRWLAYSPNRTEDPRDIKFISSLSKSLYSWWQIFWDIVIGLNIRK